MFASRIMLALGCVDVALRRRSSKSMEELRLNDEITSSRLRVRGVSW